MGWYIEGQGNKVFEMKIVFLNGVCFNDPLINLHFYQHHEV